MPSCDSPELGHKWGRVKLSGSIAASEQLTGRQLAGCDSGFDVDCWNNGKRIGWCGHGERFGRNVGVWLRVDIVESRIQLRIVPSGFHRGLLTTLLAGQHHTQRNSSVGWCACKHVVSVYRLSSVCDVCIVAKWCVLEQKLLLTSYRKSYMRNRFVPKWITLTSAYRSFKGHVNHCVTFAIDLGNR